MAGTESGCSTNDRDATTSLNYLDRNVVATIRLCPSGGTSVPLRDSVTMTADEWPPTTTPKRDDVLATSRTVLLGSRRGGGRQSLVVGLALGLFALTFLAYELDIVSHSGGVVFVPFYAVFIGLTAAFWTGYGQIGLLSGWALTYITFLGWRTEWATGISPRPLTERIAYIVQPDGLVVLAIIGIGVTVIGFTAGTIARKGIDRLHTGF